MATQMAIGPSPASAYLIARVRAMREPSVVAPLVADGRNMDLYGMVWHGMACRASPGDPDMSLA